MDQNDVSFEDMLGLSPLESPEPKKEEVVSAGDVSFGDMLGLGTSIDEFEGKYASAFFPSSIKGVPGHPPPITKPTTISAPTTKRQPMQYTTGVMGIPMRLPTARDEWGTRIIKPGTDFKSTIEVVSDNNKPSKSYMSAKVHEPTLIQQVIGDLASVFGVDYDPHAISEVAKAQALVQLSANRAGIPIDKYRYSPELIEQAAQGFANMVTFGLEPAIRKALTGEESFQPTGLQGHIGMALGSLAGLVAGPFSVAKWGLSPVLTNLPKASQEAGVVARVLMTALQDSVVLGVGFGAAATGEALQQTTFTEFEKVIKEAVASGALTGAIFGTAKGMFPGEELAQRASRIITGIVMLNAQRVAEEGGNPFTDRPVGEVLFDIALDTYFLWKGLPSNRFEALAKAIESGDPRVAIEAMEGAAHEAMARADAEATKKRIDDIKRLEKAAAESFEVRPEEFTALEKRFGENWDEQPSERIQTFLEKYRKAKKPVEKPEERLAKEVVGELERVERTAEIEAELDKYDKDVIEWETTKSTKVEGLTDIEAATGKSLDRLEPEDVERFLDNEAVERAINDIDLDTGTAKPARLSGDMSPFRVIDEGVIRSQTTSYSRNSLVAKEMSELTSPDPDNPKDPMLTSHKIVNDMNRWLNGEMVDPAASRDFLSRLAGNADDMRWSFVDEEGNLDTKAFKEWRSYVQEAAEWARTAERARESTTRDLMGKTHLFIDPTKAPQVVRELYEGLKSDLSKRETVDLKEIWKETGFSLNPYDRKWRFELDDSKMRLTDKLSEMKPGKIGQEGDHAMLEEVIEYPDFFNAYPDARNITVSTRSAPFDFFKSTQGWYDSTTNELVVAPHASNPKTTVLHELQHWVQYREGFAQGGSARRVLDLAGPKALRKIADRTIIELTNKIETKRRYVDWADKAISRLTAIPQERAGELHGFSLRYAEIKAAERSAYNDFTSRYPSGKERPDFYSTDIGKTFETQKENLYKNLANLMGTDKLEALRLLQELNGKPLNQAIMEQRAKLAGLRNEIDEAKGRISSLNRIVDEQELRNLIREIGSVDYDAYKALAGEIEARDVEARAFYTPEQRRAIMPLTSENYRPGDVIVHFGGGITSESAEPTLYAGIPLDKVGKMVGDFWKASKEASRVKAKDARNILRESLTRHWLNQSGNIRRDLERLGGGAYDIIQAQTLARGGHPHAVNMYRQARREYRRGMSKNEREITDKLIMARRMMAISESPSGPKFNYPEAFTPESSKKIIRNIGRKKINGIADITPAQVAKIEKAAQSFFDWNRIAVEDAFKADLIGANERDALLTYDYLRFSNVKKPTIAGIFDKERKAFIGGRKRSVYDSGIETLAKGQKTDILETNSELMLLETFTRLYSRVHNNLANRELLYYARNNRTNDFVRVREPQIERLSGEPKSRSGLIRSIHIQKDLKGMSDYEYRTALKAAFKRSSTKRLTNEQLLEFAKSLGGDYYDYAPLAPEEKIPKGWRRHYVYEHGARKSLWLSPEFSKEWLSMSSELTGSFAKFLRVLSGAPIVRLFATGINPVFAVANLPRDVMHAWFAARVMENGKWRSLYSPIAPKAMAQMASDFRDVFYDALHRTGRYNDYINEGGGMDFLVQQGMLSKGRGYRLETGFDKVENVLSYLNLTSELMTRLAIRERVIKRRAKERGISVEKARKDPKITREATFAAVDQMNFGEGGGFSKAVDNFMPYLNARIVGTRTLFRSFKPGSGDPMNWLKLATFASTIVALYSINKKKNPETMKDLEDDPRARNSLAIPLGDKFGYTDEQGNKRYPFFRMPIDQSQVFFKVLFEALTDKFCGREANWDSVVKALRDASPADISTLPPTLSAIMGYFFNIDTWRAKPVWQRTEEPLRYRFPYGPETDKPKPLVDISPKGSAGEVIPGITPKFYEDIGTATGLSPERLRFAVEELLTSDNIYAQFGLKAYDEIFGNLPESQREELLADAISKVPGVRRFYGVTNPEAGHLKDVDEIADERRDINWQINSGLDEVTDGYLYAGTKSYDDVMDYIAKWSDPAVRDRLVKDYLYQETIKELPHHRWWKYLRRLDTQGRAEAYVKRMRNATPAEIDQLNNESAAIMAAGGVFTKDFIVRVHLLEDAEQSR